MPQRENHEARTDLYEDAKEKAAAQARAKDVSENHKEGVFYGGEAEHVEKFPQTHPTSRTAANSLHGDITRAIATGKLPDGAHQFIIHKYDANGKQPDLIGRYHVKDGAHVPGNNNGWQPDLDGLKKYAETGHWI
jgi:hypothetical protein